ncbi:MAG: serine hydrolase domain-containing protein, partial [Bacteroidota bacterium]
MKPRLILWSVCLLFTFSTCTIDHNYQLKKTFKRIVPELLEEFDIPGAALIVVEDGKVDYEQYSGFVDPEAKTKWQANTQVPVPGVEESLIAWLLLQQVNQGTLEIDTPIK